MVADVILGVVEPKIPGMIEGPDFTVDANKALTAAIMEAERNDTPNRIVLKVWRPETFQET
jgi:hypothetical protein